MKENDGVTVEKTRATKAERMSLMLLATMLSNLEDSAEPPKRRMAHDRYAARGLAVAAKNVKRAIDAASETMEADSLAYILKNSRDYEYVIRLKRVVKDPSWMYIKTDDLREMLSMVMDGECSMCLREGKDMERCALRKSLRNMTDEPETAFGCGYRAHKA
jgi:hypothetical protein